MNKAEYQEYEARVKAFFDSEGITNLSSIDGEPYYSKSRCDCCHAGPGDREDCNGYIPATKQTGYYSVCTDCVYYAEYGCLDDKTMLEIEE